MCRRAMSSIHASYYMNVTRDAVRWILLLGARENLKEVQEMLYIQYNAPTSGESRE
jgi:hypothetical protein